MPARPEQVFSQQNLGLRINSSFSKITPDSDRSCRRKQRQGDKFNMAFQEKMECFRLHQNESDIAKQNVGLAGHSASPHSTALVLNVSPSTVWSHTNVDLKAKLRVSCSEQEFFLGLAKNTPMAQTWKTKVDILTHTSRTWAQIAGSSLFLLCRQIQFHNVTTCHMTVKL